MKTKCILQSSDVINKNNRIYPKHILEKVCREWDSKYIKEDIAFISLPNEEMNLTNIVCKITEIKMEDNNLTIDVEVFPTIANSQTIIEGIRDGHLHCRMSGIGTVTKQPDGTNVVGDDYELCSIFVTNDPA